MEITEDKITKILKYILWGSLYFILAMPLLVGSSFIFPFITLKTIYFKILVEISAFIYILLALSNSYYRPKLNKLLWLIIAFGGIILLTSFTGVNPYRSLWGTIERGEGFLFISHLFVFTFIVSQTFKTRSQWFIFFKISILISVIVGIYALAQKYGADFVLKNSAGDRFASTLGNASYLGAYALGHFWLSILLFWDKKNIIYRFVFSLVAIFQVYILFQTQTRGAMIAFFISLFIYLLFYLFYSSRKTVKKIALMGIIVLALGIFSIYLTRNTVYMKNGPFHRLLTINKNSITVESRIFAAESSWKALKSRPILGYGWENYNIAFNKYFHQEIYRDAGSQIWFDRAHNTVFDVAVASGIIGLLIYLAIFTQSLNILRLKIKKNRENYHIVAALSCFLIAHFIQNIFVFDSLPTYLMLFSVFGFISYLSSESAHYKAKQKINQKPINLYVFAIGITIVILSVYHLNIKPARANMLGIKGLIAFYNNDISNGIKYFEQGIKKNTYQTPELRQKLAENVMARNTLANVKDKSQLKKNFSVAIEELKNNIKIANNDVQHYQYLMALYNTAAPQVENADYLNQVIFLGSKAIELSPTRPQIYFEIGKAYLNSQQIERGIAFFEKGANLVPTNIDAQWNLLAAYAIAGKSDKVEEELQKMLDAGMKENIANLERLAKLFSGTGLHFLNISIYQKLIILDSENINYWTKLASTYKEIGQPDEAIKVANQMLLKFPQSREQIFEFINTTKKQ